MRFHASNQVVVDSVAEVGGEVFANVESGGNGKSNLRNVCRAALWPPMWPMILTFACRSANTVEAHYSGLKQRIRLL